MSAAFQIKKTNFISDFMNSAALFEHVSIFVFYVSLERKNASNSISFQFTKKHTLRFLSSFSLNLDNFSFISIIHQAENKMKKQ